MWTLFVCVPEVALTFQKGPLETEGAHPDSEGPSLEAPCQYSELTAVEGVAPSCCHEAVLSRDASSSLGRIVDNCFVQQTGDAIEVIRLRCNVVFSCAAGGPVIVVPPTHPG